MDLLRFRTSKGGEAWVSLKEVAERMQPDQQAIYYVLGEDLNSVARSPHLDYFRAHDIEVLYLVDPIDGYVTSLLHEAAGKPLQNVDDAGLSLPEEEETEAAQDALPQAAFDPLLARIKTVLGDRVRDVQESKQLVNSPCR